MSYTPRWYQAEATEKAVQFLRTTKGQNGLVVLPTGSGKSVVIASIIKELGAPTLVFQPSKEILAQNAAKYRAYGYGCGIYSASAGEKRLADVTFATIGSVVKKKHLLERFRYVLVDECFPAGTLIDGRPIETIQPGEMVNSLNHNTGMVEKRRVVRLFRNKAKGRMVVVTLSDGSSIACTENHPFFVVGKGYISACDLTTSSVLLKHGKTKTTEELRELRKGLSSKHKGKKGCVLFKGVREGVQGEEQAVTFRDLPRLLKADDNTREPKDELHRYAKSVLQSGVLKEVPAQRQANHNERISGAVFQANEGAEPYVDARRQGENDGELQGQYVPIARGQRGAHQAPADAASCDRITDGARYRNGSGEGGTSITSAPLQSGPCSPRGETCDRGGWQDAQAEEVAILGPQENHGLEFVGVASVEVYQRTGGGRDAEVCQDDTVYNFEVENNNNYFANGVLVHNCHLVNADGGMYEELIGHLGVPVMGLTATPYRLAQGTNPHTFQRYSILKFLTRTNPRIFDKVVYHVQNRVLFDEGYLAKLEYYSVKVINRNALQKNSTGADYTDESLRQQYAMNDMPGKVVKVVRRLFAIGRKNVLVFTRFTEEARFVASQIQGAAIVTAETPPKERDRIIRGFRDGWIKCVCNVGILCLDEQTEILTSEGWIGIDGMRKDHQVACWSMDGSIRFAPPKRIIIRPRGESERMVSAKGNAIDFRVTEGHRIIRSEGHDRHWREDVAVNLHGKRFDFPSSGLAEPHDIKPEQEVVTKDRRRRRINSTMWNYCKAGMDALTARTEAENTVDRRIALRYKSPIELSLDECRFIGFWLGDGTLSKGRCTITQSRRYPNVIEWFEGVLDRSGLHRTTTERPQKGKMTASAITWAMPRGTGSRQQFRDGGYYALEPYLNKEGSALMWGLNREQYMALLEGFWYADGWHGTQRFEDSAAKRWVITGTQKRLYDLLQAIGVCRGIRSTICKKNAPINDSHTQQWSFRWRITDRTTIGNGRPVVEDGFKKERVWCVESETSFIVTRRNGKVTITGNCTGFDYPELEAVVMARPTMSLALWYQIVGRGIRPHPDKTHTMIVDMGGNLEVFGKVEDLTLSDHKGWHIHGADGRPLTGVPFGERFVPSRV